MSSRPVIATHASVEELCEEIPVAKVFTAKQLENVVRASICSDEQFVIDHVKLHFASAKKLGFLGDHLKLSIAFKTNGKMRVCNYFVKTMPMDNVEKANFINDNDYFGKEVAVYKVMELVSNGDSKLWFPKRFFSSDGTLVLEDLNIAGYKSQNPRNIFTKEHCFTSLTSLAKQQACCLAYEERKTEELGKIFRLEDMYGGGMGVGIFEMAGYYEVGMYTTLAIAQSIPKYAGKVDLIKSRWIEVWTENLKLAVTPVGCRSVISQRDLWGRNLMFEYQGNKPTDCLIVDFQTSGFAPPSADIMSLLYINVLEGDRAKWMSECVEHFYSELKKNLKEQYIDIATVLPKNEYLKLCDKYKRWGAIHSCVEQHMIQFNDEYHDYMLNSSEAFGSIMNTVEGRLSLVSKALKEDDYYRKRIYGCIEDFVDNYIL